MEQSTIRTPLCTIQAAAWEVISDWLAGQIAMPTKIEPTSSEQVGLFSANNTVLLCVETALTLYISFRATRSLFR